MHSISMEYSIEYSRFPAILFIKSVYKLLPTSHVTFFFFLFETQCEYSLLLSVQITLRCSARVQVFLSEEKYALHFCSFRLQRCNLTFINVFPWRVSPRTRDSSRDTYVWRSAYLSSRSRRRYFTRPKREILPLLYRATRSHTRVAGNDIAVPSSNTICPPLSLSLLFLLSPSYESVERGEGGG